MCWSSGWRVWKAASAAVAASSGHGAQTMAVLTLCGAGDHIVTSSRLYGGTYNQFNYTFPRLGIDVTFVDPSDPSNFEQAIRPNTKIIYGETLGNPGHHRLPVRGSRGDCQGAQYSVDDRQYLCHAVSLPPFEWGANIVMHSTTKFIGGHGTTIGGIIVDGSNFDWHSGRFDNFTDAGPQLSWPGLCRFAAAAVCDQGARADAA